MIALVAILAAALGAAVTMIAILLFLRSHSAHHTAGDVDRQIAEARVEMFRDLQRLTKPPNGTAGGAPHEKPVAVNGSEPASSASQAPTVLRTKKNLSLLRGGSTGALAIGIAGFLREHRAHMVGTLAGTATMATSVTLMTVTPWTDGADREPPSSTPTATVTVAPPRPARPLAIPASGAPSASPPDSAPPPARGESATSSTEPGESAQASPAGEEPSLSTVPIGDGSPAPTPSTSGTPDPGRDGGDSGDGRDGEQPGGGRDGRESPPAPAPSSPPPQSPPPPAPPPSATPADRGLCLDTTVPPLPDAGACPPVPAAQRGQSVFLGSTSTEDGSK